MDVKELNGKNVKPATKGNRKTFDLKVVERLASLGATPDEICYVIGICRATFTSYQGRPDFMEAIERGRATGCVSLRRMQWQSASKGSVPMQIFLGKVILKQNETTVHEIHGYSPGNVAREIRGALSEMDRLDATVTIDG